MASKVFPDAQVGCRAQCPHPNPLLSFSPAPRTSTMEPLLAEPPLMGFLAPTAHEAGGSDLHRACLTRLCCASGLSRALDALFLPLPSRLCFTPLALMGFLSPEVFPPPRPERLSALLPLMMFCSGPLPRRGFGGPWSSTGRENLQGGPLSRGSPRAPLLPKAWGWSSLLLPLYLPPGQAQRAASGWGARRPQGAPFPSRRQSPRRTLLRGGETRSGPQEVRGGDHRVR
jgi:hypothetical protein